MFPPPILAHGALGVYDELIFATIAFFFVAMMAFSWWKSRSAHDGDVIAAADSPPDAPIATSTDAPEHFRLD